jgi:hypothetical protein
VVGTEVVVELIVGVVEPIVVAVIAVVVVVEVVELMMDLRKQMMLTDVDVVMWWCGSPMFSQTPVVLHFVWATVQTCTRPHPTS